MNTIENNEFIELMFAFRHSPVDHHSEPYKAVVAYVDKKLNATPKQITLRDQFAMMAMQALLTGMAGYSSSDITKKAYQIADKMIEVREL